MGSRFVFDVGEDAETDKILGEFSGFLDHGQKMEVEYVTSSRELGGLCNCFVVTLPDKIQLSGMNFPVELLGKVRQL